MWFDASAALAELGEGRVIDAPTPAAIATPATLTARVAGVATPPATTATSATPAQRDAPVVASVASVATPPARNHEFDHSRHGASIAGHPLTWTGRVVSLADWHKLTAWDRHGPNGRHWCGIRRTWTEPKGE